MIDFLALWLEHRREGGGGNSHILIKQVCAAVQGAVFKLFCQKHDGLGQEHGVKFKSKGFAMGRIPKRTLLCSNRYYIQSTTANV